MHDRMSWPERQQRKPFLAGRRAHDAMHTRCSAALTLLGPRLAPLTVQQARRQLVVQQVQARQLRLAARQEVVGAALRDKGVGGWGSQELCGGSPWYCSREATMLAMTW